MSATNRNGLRRHPFDFYETPDDAIDVVLDSLGITPDFDGYVVDAGCGNGAIAARIAARAPNADVRGIELQPELVARAKEKRLVGVAWEQADWLTWTPDGTPDLVISNPPYQETRWNPDAPIPKRWTKRTDSAIYVATDGYTISPHCEKGWATWKGSEMVGSYAKLADAKHAASLHDPARGRTIIVDPDLAEKFIRKALQVAGKKGSVAMLLRDSYMIPKARRALRAEYGKPDIFALEKRPSFNGSGTDATDYGWFVWGPKRAGKWSVLEPPPSTPLVALP